jgi:hypothetical protein
MLCYNIGTTKGNIMDSDNLTNYFMFNRMFRPYTNPFRSYDYGIKDGDTSKKRKMRKEIARKLTKMNMEKKKQIQK